METTVLLYEKIDNSKTVFPESTVAGGRSCVVLMFLLRNTIPEKRSLRKMNKQSLDYASYFIHEIDST